MILRRLTNHIASQNWLAVILDFAIVVTGVFIGIEVSNWNQARADKHRATGYLERIAADLKVDLSTYEDRMDFWSKVSDYGAIGLKYARTRESDGASQWQLLLSYFQASQIAGFFRVDTTYDELKSAGELDLIADTALRDALAHYYSFGINTELTERPAYREHVRGRIPIDVQSHIWRTCYSSDAQGRQQMLGCDSPIDEHAAKKIVKAISDDDALMAELRYWMSTMHVATLIGRDRSEAASKLLEKVEAKVNKR